MTRKHFEGRVLFVDRSRNAFVQDAATNLFVRLDAGGLCTFPTTLANIDSLSMLHLQVLGSLLPLTTRAIDSVGFCNPLSKACQTPRPVGVESPLSKACQTPW
jgi:hypothetical protein